MIQIPLNIIVKLMDREIAIYDIDMTLIDARLRYMTSMEKIGYPPTTPYHKLPKNKRMKFWDTFLDEKYLFLDKPIDETINDLRSKYENNMGIILITGRPTRLEKATKRQLLEFNIPYHMLIMRPQGNYDPDHILKLNIIETLVNYGLNIQEYHEDNVKTIRTVIERFPWIKVYHHKIKNFETGFGLD